MYYHANVGDTDDPGAARRCDVAMDARAARIAAVVALAAAAALALAPAASARKLTLGMQGPDVRHLQSDLARLGYLPASAVTARFDQRTWHAVVALQGWQRIARDGVVGASTRRALRSAAAPVASSRRAGIEVHVDAQVMLLVGYGRRVRAVHVSTGAGGRTPYGRFAISSRQLLSWSRPFKVWMPLAQYFSGGFALHENPSVPAYPASHGCVRVPPEESAVVWRHGRIGERVWVVPGHTVARRVDPRRSETKRTALAVAAALRRLHPLSVRA